jgi:hypothetical protein
MGKAAWHMVKREPVYKAIVKAIVDMTTLTKTMKGAVLSLIQ